MLAITVEKNGEVLIHLTGYDADGDKVRFFVALCEGEGDKSLLTSLCVFSLSPPAPSFLPSGT